MKISCLTEKLKNYISIIERFTGKNINLPILNNILINAKDNNIILSATNLEIGAEVAFACKVLKEGSITVPAKIFSQVINSLDNDKVNLEEKNSILEVKTEDSSVKINGLSSKEFPIIPRIKKVSCSFNVEEQNLINSIVSVLPSVSSSEIKPEISGVYFSISGENMKVVGTDTFRLAESKVDLLKKADSMSFILPKSTALEVGRIGKDGEVNINIGDNQIEFNFENIFLISRLVEGKFPEYEGIIPKNFETIFEVEKEEFIRKVKASSILSSKLNDITLKVDSGLLKIVTSNPEVGEYTSSLELGSKPNPVVVSFNHRYLLDGLGSINDNVIYFQINGETNPAMLRGKSDRNFIYIIMPIKNIG